MPVEMKTRQAWYRRPGVVVAACGGAAVAAWLAYASLRGESGPIRIDTADRELVKLGKAVYAAQCASCHGAALEGQPDWRSRLPDGTLPAPPHDEGGHTWHHPDHVLFRIVEQGGQAVAPTGFKSGMPGFGGTLSDREIAASLAYIKSRWPEEIRRRQDRINAQAH